MEFSKVYITWKREYGEQIVLKLCSMLREYGIAHVFDEPQDCDLAIMVGGDGTMLKHQSFLECPMFSINPGKSVGHYSTATGGDFVKKVRKLFGGREGKDYFIREFTRLETVINNTKMPFQSINEVLVSPIYVRRLMKAELTIDGRKTRERNSGIIVYTPSGSYAYAKAAGAKPFDTPGRFGVVAVAPYDGRLRKGAITMTKGKVTITCASKEGEVCSDGQEEQACKLGKGDVVIIKKGGKPARIIFFKKT